MQLLHYFIFFLLCGFSVLSYTASLQCNEEQYAWPLDKPKHCCDKCPPGHKMKRSRNQRTCGIECIQCEGERFSDNYNVDLSCKVCEVCNKPNMDYKSKCNSTHNTVCKCNPGYRCKDQACTQCVLVTPTTKSTSPPSTTANTVKNMGKSPVGNNVSTRGNNFKCNSTHSNPGYRCKDQACTQCVLVTPTTKPISLPFTTASKAVDPATPEEAPHQVRDTVLLLVIISLLCLGIALLAVAKMKPFLQWMRTHTVYIVTDKHAEKPLRAEDEDMPKPVQEACGKCEQCIDICVRD
ncbi:tumor necrosis factor receptor superfamily member 3 [Oryzias latipes]|uniref:tumor necrosis factor receptor superfamily member 3 n=1 Tax=Oryzias latipes TaxID=8090 RepID=UPI0005CBD858|nr:tumor necrosis factor receptor superfamily member 3 [Oryzias latipes]